MNEMQLIGYAVTAIITLGGFIAVIQRFTQPINELRIAIQKLIDNIDSIKNDNQRQGDRINEHGRQIDSLQGRVGQLETKMDMYHHHTESRN